MRKFWNDQCKRDTVTLLPVSLKTGKKNSHVRGALSTSGSRTLITRGGRFEPRSLYRQTLLLNLLSQAQTPFRFFTNWGPKLKFLTPVNSHKFIVCLKSINTASFGYFGRISMRPLCSPFKLFLFLLLICPVLISLLVQLQEPRRGRGESSSSLTGVQITQYLDVFSNPKVPHMYYWGFYETSSHSKVMLKILQAWLQ